MDTHWLLVTHMIYSSFVFFFNNDMASESHSSSPTTEPATEPTQSPGEYPTTAAPTFSLIGASASASNSFVPQHHGRFVLASTYHLRDNLHRALNLNSWTSNVTSEAHLWLDSPLRRLCNVKPPDMDYIFTPRFGWNFTRCAARARLFALGAISDESVQAVV